jgi:hypothetical protein
VRGLILIGLAFAAIVLVWLLPFFGIPKGFIFGVLGLRAVFGGNAVAAGSFAQPEERWPFIVLFAGVLLTGIG